MFSSNDAQENSLQSKKYAYDNVGWSPSDSRDRRLFGLVKFANFVTSLAMKKQGSKFKQDIMPHHVFQLQCIVDSMTVSRGWSWSAFRGQVLEAPAADFRPRRDVDLFLDRQNKRPGSGYLKGISVLQQLLQQKEVSHGNFAGHVSIAVVLEHIKRDLTNWLGESKYMHGLQGVPPSRFSKTNANGLWEYSPFLCGTGLAEVLQLAYTLGMTLWDKNPEPMMAIHIHNMLVQKGVIDRPVLLYEGLQALFNDILFVSGIAPTDRFAQDLQVKLTSDEELNHFIKRKSSLILYELARWDPDAIPDSEVVVPSPLFMQKLDRMKIAVNPQTKEDYLEDCDLVRRAKQSGVTEDEVFGFMATRKRIQDGISTPESSDDGENLSTEDSSTANIDSTATEPRNSSDADSMTPRALLDWVKHDLLRDVNGRAPLSSVNYLWVAARFMVLFKQVEERLETLRNPVHTQIYGMRGPSVGQKRVSLTLSVLSGQDEEYIRVFAEEIETLRSSFLDHIYWEGLEVKDDDDMFRPGMAKACDAKDQDVCRLM